jgi:O-methyltransferase involved in polyketide biosynthesis
MWERYGLSHPGLVLRRARWLERATRPVVAGTRLLSGVSLDALMEARHRGIDALLTRAIEEGRVSQVIELAAGLSPRGWRFAKRYGARITYVETDLPHMVAAKRRLLKRARLESPHHRSTELNALAVSGANSLAGICDTLDRSRGVAIITEGLMNYLDPAQARGVWRRVASQMQAFPQGLYLSDVYLATANRGLVADAFLSLLSTFVRGRVHLHFDSERDAIEAMREAGFATAQVHASDALPETRALAGRGGTKHVQILEART